MNEVPWQTVIVANLVALIIICATVLAYFRVASWQDVFTIYLIVLSGLGFATSGMYYGQAKAYREALMLITKKEKQSETPNNAGGFS
ncbi:MAG: hypothetical protein QXT44_07430 [Candidatus Bathyarchaeia archaeon]